MFAGFDKADAKTIWNFFRMFLRDRYLGSKLGAIWAVANPLFLLSVYTFVFGFIFKTRLPGADTTLSYTIWLIAGLGPWLAIVEGLTSAGNAIHANAGIVKNLAIKTECLPIAAALCCLVPLLVSFAFIAVLLVVDGRSVSWHALALIPAILALVSLVIALGIGLSAPITFFRDLGVALPNVLMIILFATPILYPVSAVPRFLHVAAEWNPFYILAEWVREPLLNHTIPPLTGLIWVFAITILIGWLSLAAFRRVKGFLHSAV